MSDLITGRLPNGHKIQSVKYLTQSVWFNYQSISKLNQTPISKTANTEFLV